MSLTVREKQHWKERIERRIDRRIKEIEALEPAHVWDEIKRRAEQLALQDLGIAVLAERATQIEKKLAELGKEQRQVWTQMLAITRGVDVSQVDSQTYTPHEVRNAITARKEVYMRQLREEHPKGRLIEKLGREKEELLDTVWLATSPSQIKELWSQIAGGLESELTPFQQQALAIAPLAGASSDD